MHGIVHDDIQHEEALLQNVLEMYSSEISRLQVDSENEHIINCTTVDYFSVDVEVCKPTPTHGPTKVLFAQTLE